MTELVGFKRHLHAEVIAGDATYLLSEREVLALQGAHVAAVAPLLDGSRDLAAVQRELAPGVPAAQVEALVGALDRAGLLARRSAPGPDGPGTADEHAQEAYWDLAGLPGEQARARTAATSVAVLATAGADRTGLGDAMAEACRQAGLAVTDPTDEAAALTLVVCEDYLAPELARIDAEHRATGRPWLLVRPAAAEPWVGPVLRPGEGPCWHCLAHRLRAHRASELPVRRALGLDGPAPRPTAVLPAVRATALHLAALEAAKWLAGLRHPGQSAIHTLNSVTLAGRDHEVRQRPQCPQCGDPGLVARQVARPVAFTSRLKVAGAGGGHRSQTPRQMLDRYRHLVSPVTGLVQELRPERRGPEFLHGFTSGRNLAMGSGTLKGLRAGLRGVSGGKGVTALDAEVGALCEALERYSGSLQGDEPRIRERFGALGPEAVHPDACQLFDPRQYDGREEWNARQMAFHQVPEPFDPDVPVDWTPVWSVLDQRQRLLPTAMLYFDGGLHEGVPPVAGNRFVHADSNGNAAGSCIEDAVLQGFLELVERDAVALWWYNRTRQPGVDLSRFADPWVTELVSVYASVDREVWALDLTADLGIPVFVALSRRTDKPAEDIVFGFGAHFDPALALRRALTEMNQLLPAVVAVTADGTGYGLRDPELTSWWQGSTVADQPYLLPAADWAARTPADFDHRPRADLREDLRAVEELLRGHGLDLLVLDQTRPDIGLPVVKVIVPGLRHFWARYAPGRLYDVPVRLGRLAAPTRYEDLNPIPLFV
ncbi:TOMM precursor leader peptide-binding protein [Kitasatospora sp. NPDC094028]